MKKLIGAERSDFKERIQASISNSIEMLLTHREPTVKVYGYNLPLSRFTYQLTRKYSAISNTAPKLTNLKDIIRLTAVFNYYLSVLKWKISDCDENLLFVSVPYNFVVCTTEQPDINNCVLINLPRNVPKFALWLRRN